jgi:hypothetical protein
MTIGAAAAFTIDPTSSIVKNADLSGTRTAIIAIALSAISVSVVLFMLATIESLEYLVVNKLLIKVKKYDSIFK